MIGEARAHTKKVWLCSAPRAVFTMSRYQIVAHYGTRLAICLRANRNFLVGCMGSAASATMRHPVRRILHVDQKGSEHLSRVNDVLFRTLRIERDITIFPDDVFSDFLPAIGQYVDRFLVGNLAHTEEAVTFLNVERLVPTCTSTATITCGTCRGAHPEESRGLRPEVQAGDLHRSRSRDVAVSNYHWEMKQRR